MKMKEGGIQALAVCRQLLKVCFKNAKIEIRDRLGKICAVEHRLVPVAFVLFVQVSIFHQSCWQAEYLQHDPSHRYGCIYSTLW